MTRLIRVTFIQNGKPIVGILEVPVFETEDNN